MRTLSILAFLAVTASPALANTPEATTATSDIGTVVSELSGDERDGLFA